MPEVKAYLKEVDDALSRAATAAAGVLALKMCQSVCTEPNSQDLNLFCLALSMCAVIRIGNESAELLEVAVEAIRQNSVRLGQNGMMDRIVHHACLMEGASGGKPN